MKQRVLVMNGQRLLQNEILGKWVVAKVDKAGALKPGIYNINSAVEVNKKIKNAGVVVHANDKFMYQQVNNSIVRHAINQFKNFPAIGSDVEISYSGKEVVIESGAKIRNAQRVRR